jgi:hypothetical protein
VATGSPYKRWKDDLSLTYRFVTRQVPASEFLERYDRIPARRKFSELVATGKWIREHTTPDDLVSVRGVSAEIYVISGRRAPTRFFWTAFLYDASRAYKAEEWRREDEEALRSRPPKFIVIQRGAPPAVVEPITRLGYRLVKEVGSFRILAKDGAFAP